MSLNAQIQISTEAQAALERLRRFPERAPQAIATALDHENELTVGHIQANYLTGPRPTRLGVRSGRLRRSIRRLPARIKGDDVDSSIGSNVSYAGIHERGFEGPIPVRAHTRTIEQAFGQLLKSPVTVNVRAHTRDVDVPQRAFLRPGIDDRIPEYEAHIARALTAAAEEN